MAELGVRSRRRALAALVASLTAGVTLLLPAAAQAAPTAHVASHVAVIGVGGLQPADIDPARTPELWALSEGSSIGAISVRSVRSYSCPADGWLALSTGTRAADLPGDAYGECRTLRDPTTVGRVPGWTDYETAAKNDNFDAKLGSLNDSLAKDGATAAAIGPGAAIATATPAGEAIENYHRRPSDPADLGILIAAVSPEAKLIVVDAGEIRGPGRETVSRPEPPAPPTATPSLDPEAEDGATPPVAEEITPGDPEDPVDPDVTAPPVVPSRAEQAQMIDARVGAVTRNLPKDTTIILSSLADSSAVPRLQFIAIRSAPGVAPSYSGGLLRSPSTRQDGIAQTTDLVPTITEALGIVEANAPSGLTSVDEELTARAGLIQVQDIARAAAFVHPRVSDYFSVLIVTSIALMALVAITWRTRWFDRLIPGSRKVPKPLGVRRFWANMARRLAIPLASLPIATTLANLTPWLLAPNPMVGLAGAIALWVAVISAVALLAGRRSPIGALTVVATVTVLTLAVDVATGATLQISNLIGVQPIVAGRFYGFSNNSFPLFATALIFLTAIGAQWLIGRGRRSLAVVMTVAVGAGATLFVGAPGLGSDFGGTPSLIPGFAIMAILLAGTRVSWKKLIVIGAITAAAMAAFCFADWLRPAAQRTHLGRFFQTVLDGGLFSVIQRKLTQNLAILTGSWLTVLTVAGVVFIVVILLRKTRWEIATMPTIAREYRGAFAALIGWATMMVIGLLVNDSGILVPALGIVIGLPMIVEICARHLRDAPEPDVALTAGAADASDSIETGSQPDSQSV